MDSGFYEMFVLHLLAVRMWLDNMLTSIYPALEFVEDMIYYGVPLIYPIYFVGFHIYKHRSHWNQPDEQKRTIVLVSIPVVVGIVSWVALHVNEDSKTLFLLFDSIKECSAGLGIAIFMGLLQAYLNLNTSKLLPVAFRRKIRLVYNVFPVNLVQSCRVLDRKSLNDLKLLNSLTWQFVIVRLVCSIIMIALQLCQMYPLWLSWLFFVLLNVSASLAFYTVSAFYIAMVEDFPRHLSYSSFLCIKGIFFVCFLQGDVLKALVAMGIIKSNHFWRQELHNSLMVLEMAIFTIFQLVAYSFRFHDLTQTPRLIQAPRKTWSRKPASPVPASASARRKLGITGLK